MRKHKDSSGIPDLVYKLEETEPQFVSVLHAIARDSYVSGYTDGLRQAAVRRHGEEPSNDQTFETHQQFGEELIVDWQKSLARWLVYDFPEEQRPDDNEEE